MITLIITLLAIDNKNYEKKTHQMWKRNNNNNDSKRISKSIRNILQVKKGNRIMEKNWVVYETVLESLIKIQKYYMMNIKNHL